MTPRQMEDLAMVVRLAILTEDRDPNEQAALLRVARMVDDQRSRSDCSLRKQAVVTWGVS